MAAALSVSNGRADIKVNDNITFSGYAAGAYMNYKASGFEAVDGIFDASKPIPGGGDSNDVLTKFTLNYKPVTAVISLNYFPNLATNELTVLDAYATYDAGGGLTVTGGKFLSYLGYESFYPSLMDQITYANGDFVGAIPGYHTGLKIDYADKTQGFGAALVDSVYSPYGGTKGDGELKKNVGTEVYYTYTGVENLVLWAGLAYDGKGGFQPHNITTFDVWASYQVMKPLRVAAEFVVKDGGTLNRGTSWLVFANYSVTDKFSTTFRVGGDNFDKIDDGEGGTITGPSFVKYTVSPSYAVTSNLILRAEYSHYEYSKYVAKTADFFGVQGVFKF
jgi:hypothetical protein